MTKPLKIAEKREKISIKDLEMLSGCRNFSVNTYFFKDSGIVKKAQAVVSWYNINRLRRLGLNMVTRSEGDSLTIKLEEYNYG